MVVEKQRFLYGSDVAAPTIPKRLQTENVNSLLMFNLNSSVQFLGKWLYLTQRCREAEF